MTIFSVADRVKETTLTTGTGTVSLGGAAVGYQSFGAAFTTGTTVYYCITDGVNWEVGEGVYTSTGDTLSRATVLASSNLSGLVNFPAGTKEVFCTWPATLHGFLIDSSAVAITGGTINGTSIGQSTAAAGTFTSLSSAGSSFSASAPAGSFAQFASGRIGVNTTTDNGTDTLQVNGSAVIGGISVGKTSAIGMYNDGSNLIIRGTSTGISFNNYANTAQNMILSDAGNLSLPRGSMTAASLATTQTPTASSTASNYSVPIVLNGVTYYMRLSTTP